MNAYNTANQSELGKKTTYDSHYQPGHLFPIPRSEKRREIGITGALPFYGYDVWNHYEVSWLNAKGKPIVAVAEIIYACDSLNIIESKSMKLYFNSFNNTTFDSEKAVQDVMQRDLAERLKGSFVSVRLIPLSEFKNQSLYAALEGFNIDALDVACSVYQTDPSFLKVHDDVIVETLYTDLLKSNCLVTNQPDWCSVQIQYQGPRIDREGLLRYIVSFRNTNEFHEQCIEKIFMHILQYCKPTRLTVYGRSTRRGGIDINAIRSTQPLSPEQIENVRLCRQ